MSIYKDFGEYFAMCDVCGEELGSFDSFYDAVDSKKSAGWRSHQDETGEWIDRCPACQRKYGAVDFRGIGGIL